MHVPDGLLSTSVLLATGVAALAGVAVASRRDHREQRDRRAPLLGSTAAFIFAAQMINVPIGPGISGHVIGAPLATYLLGPASACVTMTIVLVIQALLFADGGLTALGANILNMAILPVLTTWVLIRLIRRDPKSVRRALPAAGVFAWLGVLAASAACALEIAASGRVPTAAILPVMIGWHALIGMIEAAMTVGVLSALHAMRPDLIRVFSGSQDRDVGPIAEATP